MRILLDDVIYEVINVIVKVESSPKPCIKIYVRFSHGKPKYKIKGVEFDFKFKLKVLKDKDIEEEANKIRRHLLAYSYYSFDDLNNLKRG